MTTTPHDVIAQHIRAAILEVLPASTATRMGSREQPMTGWEIGYTDPTSSNPSLPAKWRSTTTASLRSRWRQNRRATSLPLCLPPPNMRKDNNNDRSCRGSFTSGTGRGRGSDPGRKGFHIGPDCDPVCQDCGQLFPCATARLVYTTEELENR